MSEELKAINGLKMPERIWLTDEGSGDICWANDPDPSGDGQAEAVEYVRADLTRTPTVATDEGVVELRQRIAELEAQLNTPEVDDFAKGAVLEAAHQRERWGADHDSGKSPFDWFWLVGYLAQKAASAAVAGDAEKAKHHTISTAAALANWHLSLSETDTRMRPGIDPVLAQNGGAGLSDPPNDTEREQAA